MINELAELKRISAKRQRSAQDLEAFRRALNLAGAAAFRTPPVGVVAVPEESEAFKVEAATAAVLKPELQSQVEEARLPAAAFPVVQVAASVLVLAVIIWMIFQFGG